MPTSEYYRARAEMCLRIAQSISDKSSAARLRIDAAQYLERAAEIEATRIAQASVLTFPQPTAASEDK